MTDTDDPGDLPILPRLWPGDHVGRYEIGEHLAEGSLSEVHAASDTAAPERDLVIKVMPARLLGNLPDPRLIAGIPHLVPILDSGICGEHRVGYLVMPRIRGQPLASFLEQLHAESRRPTPAEQRLLVERCREVALALAVLHGRGAFHSDIKPQNILIEGASATEPLRGRTMVVDLGLLRTMGGADTRATIHCTPAYAAPEQRLGLAFDGRADVFALGVVLHDLLSGQSPAHRQRPTAAGLESLAPSHADPDLAAIVAECTAPAVEHRYRHTAALVDDLSRWLAGRRPSVRPRSPWRRFQRTARRQPARAVGQLGLLVLVLAALVVGAVHHAASVRQELLAADLLTSLSEGRFDEVAHRLQRTGAPAVGELLTDAAQAAVLHELVAGAAAAARSRAAWFLSRDGVQTHDSLARWLLMNVDHQEPDVRVDACRLLASATFDRPATGAALPTTALLRVARQAPQPAGLLAITVLGGIGDLATGEALLDLTATPDATPGALEILRLVTEALHRLAARAPMTPANLATSERQLRRIFDLVPRRGTIDVVRGTLESACESWLLTLRRYRERLALPPTPAADLGLPWPASWTTRALGGDQALIDLVARNGPRALAPVELPRTGTLLCWCRPSAGQWAAVEAAVLRHEGEPALLAIREGAATGKRLLAADAALWLADRGSRLADRTAKPVAAQPLTVQRRTSADAVASWDLLVNPAIVTGLATGIQAVAARLEVDESAPPVGYGWLGSPGCSEWRLEFDCRAPLPRQAELNVEGQKGVRGCFPFGGQAALEVLFDGVRVAELRDYATSECRRLPLPVGTFSQPGPHTITIRLGADATTTSRLYRVWIR